MQRNNSIELYRVMLMVGICMLHSITVGVHNVPFVANVLLSCVVGFVFISGWFGVRFSWWKLVKLYGVGLYAALVLFLGFCLRDGGSCLANAMKAYGHLIHGFWFLHAYAFMMILAPLVNAAIDMCGKAAIIKVSPLVLLVWCLGFGLTLPVVGNMLPRMVGLDAYGGVTLLAIYAAARLCRVYEVDKWVKTKWLLVSLPILWTATGIGFGDYNSPFAFVLAGVCFLLVGRAGVGRSLGGFASALAPSVFSVYLISTNEIGFWFIRVCEAKLLDMHVPMICVFMVTAAMVFACAAVLDLPRRLVLKSVNRK